MLTALLLFAIHCSNPSHACIDNTRFADDVIQAFEPRIKRDPETVVARPRCSCRAREVRVQIDGVPICRLPTLVEVDVEPAWLQARPNTLWLVQFSLYPFVDSLMHEMVLNGDWIETRPRLRGAH